MSSGRRVCDGDCRRGLAGLHSPRGVCSRMGERRRPARHPVFQSRHLAQWSFRPWRVPVRAIGARSGWAAPENSVLRRALPLRREKPQGSTGCRRRSGSNAAMRNSNSSSDPNSRNIISCRTIRQIDCVAISSVCAWRSRSGTSRHQVRWSRRTHRCRRSQPATRRAWPTAGVCSRRCWEAFTSARSSNISVRTDTGTCVWALTSPA